MSKTSLGAGGSMTASDWRQTTITRQLEILVTTLATKQGSTGRKNTIFCYLNFFLKGFYMKQERALSGRQVSPAWRLDRKMRRGLILQET